MCTAYDDAVKCSPACGDEARGVPQLARESVVMRDQGAWRVVAQPDPQRPSAAGAPGRHQNKPVLFGDTSRPVASLAEAARKRTKTRCA